MPYTEERLSFSRTTIALFNMKNSAAHAGGAS
jgi:hypothetical protein